MYDRLKGFRDFYPGKMRARREAMDAVEASAAGYGFREIDTPALERMQMYVDKSGEEIADELYSFTDQGGRDVALTPELTPTVARMVVAKGQALSKPIKWYSTRKFWRYEEPQSGRNREFYQTNVDIFGSSEPASDAEVLAVTSDALRNLGLGSSDFEFRVSHRDILGGLLRSFDADVDVRAAIRAVDKSEKIDADEFHRLLRDAGLTDSQAVRFDDLLDAGENDLDELVDFAGENVQSAVENLRNVLAAAEDYGVREDCTVSLSTARGLDYYTGVVFECFDRTGDVNRAVFGGGRYDDLIESFGGQPTPAVGVAAGYSTLSLLLQRAGVWPDEELRTDYYVLSVGDVRPVALDVARDLRAKGHTVETDVSDRSFGSQMNYADSINAETVVIVGERDLEDDELTLKDMETGNQVAVPVDDFPDYERPTIEDYE
ncbi:histidine--tRNA ligase [Halocalculus aciditolerans]|uniref:Histidine--tRNA ligase n=1 Tax=Halocalculus aciditolerans TaxID=1383812 RepID=A0A830F097_9EURY|nr:histidine--tRNA ligase [Halocalculus aciditolerans]GGL50062.1 histidine--tRNA ligase [Halocalculus aciditolerans]